MAGCFLGFTLADFFLGPTVDANVCSLADTGYLATICHEPIAQY